jgi:predicted acylesterase/phospholipase RssA
MDVDSCISVYQKLADKVFKPKRAKFNILRKGADLWQLSGSFDADVFAQAVKDLIAETGLPADAKLLERPAPNDIMAEDEQSQCRVFVCAVRTEINKAVRLRSYTTEASVEEVSCAIWEAARATSAASSFFSHIEIEGQRFTDGATECNNPIEHLIDEAEEIWPGSSKACVVSIGTGKPKLEAFGKNLVEVGKTLIRIATDAERTAENFQQSSRERGLQDVYYRFNVSHGLENVGLESSDQQGQIWAATNHYLNNYAVKQQCRALATSLRSMDRIAN